MINIDSNNSILRTNIVSKSVGGRRYKKSKRKTVKNRKGGNIFSSLFGDKPCHLEYNNYKEKKRKSEKELVSKFKELKSHFNSLIRKLREDTERRCKEYNLKKEKLDKSRELFSKSNIFDSTHKFISTPKLITKGGFLRKMNKELETLHKHFNKQLFNEVKLIHKFGGSSDYCNTIIAENQQKEKDLTFQFKHLMTEYLNKIYDEPVSDAVARYNDCVVRYKDDTDLYPVPELPPPPSSKSTESIDKDATKFFSSMIVKDKYEKRPEIIVPKQEEKKDPFEDKLKVVSELSSQYDLLGNVLGKKDKQQNQQKDSISFDGKSYTKEDIENLKNNNSQQFNNLKSKLENKNSNKNDDRITLEEKKNNRSKDENRRFGELNRLYSWFK